MIETVENRTFPEIQLTCLAHADAAGIVLGARVPITLTATARRTEDRASGRARPLSTPSEGTRMSRRRLLAILCAAVIAVTAVPLAASAGESTSRSAQARGAATELFSPKVQDELSLIIRNAMTDNRLPGVAVGVWVPERGSYVRTFGIADRETGRAPRVRDHVRIASITKTFTATAILQLVDQGSLSLDDRLSAFFPQVDNAGAITIRQMLNMTSGIYDYTDDDAFAERFYANPTIPFDAADVFAILARHEPAFAPGADTQYCDTNYYLLGLIVEKVTGRPLSQVIRDGILEPLGLDETSYPAGEALPAPFARGYFGGVDLTDPLTDATAINPAVGAGAGAMISTLGDLRTWAKALATGTLLSPGLQAQRLQFVNFDNPGPVFVGYGLGIFKLDDLIGHNGAVIGYSTAMFYLPSNGATIVVWGNNSTNSTTPTTTIAFEIVEALFPKAVNEGVITTR
jgi:D-alanyl-D-alanine carboxypeptidase